ncbi:hypothetical protein BGI41_02400 [Methanobrevibacter sp. 87.7]|uniref:cobalt-precorrin 5A hydrolase n=1 Tax=Methanobrevibacter sp. 87.7 TaxID=387957 RepID=UPI000B64A0EE|nr:cobalamin biosynthesis protein [Methanobrevibacter sp. 87.7]OWT33433.1 hypothetical protein BGI41_02400 [Methanobrevibacter sp. 87.7]
MKIAILSVTEPAKDLALEIQEKLLKNPRIIKCNVFHKNVRKNMEFAFNNYDGIIAIMATGIIVRMIAPLIQSKDKDPAILTIDEKGNYVVSLLSGHLGGGNQLCSYIAKLINSKPVISTSTDVNFKYGIDSLAYKNFYKIIDVKKILPFNKAILDNVPLQISSDKDLKFLTKYFSNSTFTKLPDKRLGELSTINFKFSKDDEEYSIDLYEKKLVIGIGSRRGKTKNNILIAIDEVLNNLKIPISRVNSIATISIKKDEHGIIQACTELNKKLEIIDIDEVRNFHHEDCSKSDFVYNKFGIDGVCEQCAMISVGPNGKLIHKKIAMDGVTVAVAISND